MEERPLRPLHSTCSHLFPTPLQALTQSTLRLLSSIVVEARVGVEGIRIPISDLRASEIPEQRVQNPAQHASHRTDSVRNHRVQELSSEALQVVSLKKCLRVQDTASQVADIDTGERVDGASVAAELQCLRVGQVAGDQVLEDAEQGVWLTRGPAVPVLGDTLVAGCVHEVVDVAGIGEELLQIVRVEVPAWLLGSVIGHL